MVPIATPSRSLTVAVLVIVLFGVGLVQPSVNDLPGFSDHTGPTEMRVVEFERLDAGCADEVATYAGGSISNGTYEKTQFIETGSTDADLSARVERTSPLGADLSTFRVHVESHGGSASAENATCDTGVLYRLVVQGSGGSPEGLLPDAHGTRVLWLHDGRYVSCSSSTTSPLDSECERFREERIQRTWANASS